MIQFIKHIEPVLNQLVESVSLLTKSEYTQKSILLNGSSIGGHTRHIIELFQCLISGYENAVVNYENRKRDVEIETNKKLACHLLYTITTAISMPNRALNLQGFYTEAVGESYIIETNFYRELMYNLEHTIHHMALIRVAINEVSNIKLPENFGVAPATMQYKKLCAQ